MSARSQMIHRASIERDTQVGSDTWGNPDASTWTAHLSDVPCRVWYESEREVIGGTSTGKGDKTAVIENRKMIVPLGTDVTESDRITAVDDRKGVELFNGPARIESVGRRRNHLVLSIEEVS